MDADVEYVGSVGDRVVVLWLSYNDLPEVDRYVYVRIIPFDNDIGVSDSIVFRLDNNYPPVAHNTTYPDPGTNKPLSPVNVTTRRHSEPNVSADL